MHIYSSIFFIVHFTIIDVFEPCSSFQSLKLIFFEYLKLGSLIILSILTLLNNSSALSIHLLRTSLSLFVKDAVEFFILYIYSSLDKTLRAYKSIFDKL